MRGTQWKQFMVRSIECAEENRESKDLLRHLGVDRRMELAKKLYDLFPEYVESHPIISERFISTYNDWPFRSRLEFGSTEEIRQTLMEYGITL